MLIWKLLYIILPIHGVRLALAQDCDGSGVSKLVNVKKYLGIAFDCELLILDEPLTRLKLMRYGDAHRSFDANGWCLQNRPMMFPWNKRGELGVIVKLNESTVLYKVNTTAHERVGLSLPSPTAVTFRMKQPEDTCHHDWNMDLIYCFTVSISSTKNTIATITRSIYKLTYDEYIFISHEDIQMPEFANIRSANMLSYFHDNSNHIWIENGLHWIYNLDVNDYLEKQRYRLTTYQLSAPPDHMNNPLLDYADEAGLVTSHCQEKSCVVTYSKLTQSSALESTCLLKTDYRHRLGVLAERLVPPTSTAANEGTGTTVGGAEVLPVQPLDQHPDDEETEEDESDADAYLPLIILSIITFIYLNIYFAGLFYSSPNDEMRPYFIELEREFDRVVATLMVNKNVVDEKKQEDWLEPARHVKKHAGPAKRETPKVVEIRDEQLPEAPPHQEQAESKKAQHKTKKNQKHPKVVPENEIPENASKPKVPKKEKKHKKKKRAQGKSKNQELPIC